MKKKTCVSTWGRTRERVKKTGNLTVLKQTESVMKMSTTWDWNITWLCASEDVTLSHRLCVRNFIFLIYAKIRLLKNKSFISVKSSFDLLDHEKKIEIRNFNFFLNKTTNNPFPFTSLTSTDFYKHYVLFFSCYNVCLARICTIDTKLARKQKEFSNREKKIYK